MSVPRVANLRYCNVFLSFGFAMMDLKYAFSDLLCIYMVLKNTLVAAPCCVCAGSASLYFESSKDGLSFT